MFSLGGVDNIKIVPEYDSQRNKIVLNVSWDKPIECVGRKCSCRYLSPQVSNLSVVEFLPGKLNISWEINHKGTNETTYNITKILFEYRPIHTKDKHLTPFTALVNPNVSNNLDFFILNEAYNIFTLHQLYELQATFYNTFECKVINYTHFSVRDVEINDGMEARSKGFSWEVALLTIIVSMVILAAVYLIRRNRLILKEIMRNPCSIAFIRSRNMEQAASYAAMPTGYKREEELNPLYIEKEILDGTVDQYEFPRSRLKLIKEIGNGAFGQVYLAKAFTIDDRESYTFVAVKALRQHATNEEKEDFLKEISLLKSVGEHPNIVRIFGCCQMKEPYLMIMEFVPCGDLRSYLLGLREKWRGQRKNDCSHAFSDSSDCAYVVPNIRNGTRERVVSEGPSLAETEYTNLSSDGGFSTPTDYYVNKVESTLDHTELQNFALQIAKGMEHLEKIPIAHRDLAARNILINEFKTLKVSDFGMSRVGPYINNKRNKMPLRWMSLEAIENNFYDSKGDVWSFAVVLWEIGTLGAFPYEDVMDGMVLSHLQNGKRLERPVVCTDDLYLLMLRCWSTNPDLRPSFKELVELLDPKKKNVYVDFSQLNPLYVFPPSKE
ncbi:hypothetical protein FQA39_LY00907 [Lamprigera yunnana]|nr:hypothetical protein FQA39_LY00907 [Lamprigera yunnana]